MEKQEYGYLIELKTFFGKGEIADYEQFLLSHNVFKSFLLLIHQNEYLWSKGLY